RRHRAAAGLLTRSAQLVDDLAAEPGEVDARLGDHAGAEAVAFPDQAEQHVAIADVVVLERDRLAQRELQHLLRPAGEGDVAEHGPPAAGWRPVEGAGPERRLHLLPD